MAVETVTGPAPEEIRVRPAPTCTRAARGPMLVRTPREDARTRTPGAILKPTESPIYLPCLSLAAIAAGVAGALALL
jgi:hypothetical protein